MDRDVKLTAIGIRRLNPVFNFRHIQFQLNNSLVSIRFGSCDIRFFRMDKKDFQKNLTFLKSICNIHILVATAAMFFKNTITNR